MVTLKIDKDECIGCALCESMCSEVFVMKDGKASVKDASRCQGESGECDCKEVAESCPVNAIKYED